MADEMVLLDKHDTGVAVLSLNKPAKKNAICPEMMRQFTNALRVAEGDTDIRCLIVKGEGRCFCAGGDLSGVSSDTSVEGTAIDSMGALAKASKTLAEFPKPTIAMVEGYAIGGGASLALLCDLIVMEESAKCAFNFLRLGLAPEMGSMLTLAQSVGLHKAKDLFLSGRRVSAGEMMDLGLAAYVFDSALIEDETLKIAESIATIPRLTTHLFKKTTNALFRSQLDMVLTEEPLNSVCCSSSEEVRNFMMSNFMKK